jgi:CoA-transferase family III
MEGPLWQDLLAEAWTAIGASTGWADSRSADRGGGNSNRADPGGADRGGAGYGRADLGSADRGGAGLGLPVGLEVTGEHGRLPSQLAVEDVAIACAGAALLAAAELHVQRGGAAPGSARLDRGHLAAAVRSEAYLRVNGEPAGAGFAPLSRFWQAADGWVRTHANYPWHREALLHALGTQADRDSVAAAIAELRAREVEDLVVGAGGVAAEVRDEAAWLAEPAGQAVATARLVEGGPIGDAPPRRRAAGTRPASGVRVLDLTRVIAGPTATRYLAALGADVLRLDPPDRPELPLHARDGLLGKRSALLDLGTPDGAGRLHDLLSGTDVLVHGYRPHALDRFALTPGALAERHPGLVVVSLSAWGSRGPWGARRGFDSIVQAACGIATAESADGQRPGAMPCQLLDHGTGYLCAAAALRALAGQAARGGSYHCELSLARTARWLLAQPREVAEARQIPADDGERSWLTTVESGDGPVTTVAPLGRFDEDGFTWPGALSRYGGDRAAWGPAAG